MWNDLLDRWREQDLVRRMAETFDRMLEHTCWMFDSATAAILREKTVEDVCEPLYSRDRLVNRLEHEVRQLIVRHLRMNPAMELSVNLALVAMVKDAERIGDYSKNLFELAEMTEGDLRQTPLFADLDEIRQGVRRHFDAVRKALHRSDPQLADEVRAEKRAHQSRCDEILNSLLQGREKLPASLAVATALLARYYKRVEAHLGNIVDILVTPVSEGGLAAPAEESGEPEPAHRLPSPPVARE